MILVAMESTLVGNYEFLNYQNVCIYKMTLCSVNTMAIGCCQHSNKVCGVCISSLGVELAVKMCNTGEYYHILVQLVLNIAVIQIYFIHLIRMLVICPFQ